MGGVFDAPNDHSVRQEPAMIGPVTMSYEGFDRTSWLYQC